MQIGTQTLTYDNNGNTTTDDLGHTLTYDAWNRLIQVDNGTNSMMTYAYDGLGRRISETPGGEDAVTTDLFYDSSWQLVEEDNIGDSGSLHARYVWSPVYVDAMVMRDYDFTGSYDFQLNERTFVLADANYNVTALISRETVTGDANGDGFTDSLDDDIWFAHLGLSLAGGGIIGDFDHSGVTDLVDFDLWFHHLGFEGGPQWTVTERFVYDAYGTSITTDGNWTVGSDYLAWNFTFQGGRQDRVTGLINFQMRDYNPRTYTWNTNDPLGFIDGLDMRQFVLDNPLNRLDPGGTDAGVTGGDAHSGIAVEVHDCTGDVAGVLTLDFVASGYMGTPSTFGAFDNVVTGTSGFFLVTFNPSPIKVSARIPGPPKADTALETWLLTQVGKDQEWLANESKQYSKAIKSTIAGNGPWATYRVLSNNCNHFVISALGAYFGVSGEEFDSGNGLFLGIVGSTIVDALNEAGMGGGMIGSRLFSPDNPSGPIPVPHLNLPSGPLVNSHETPPGPPPSVSPGSGAVWAWSESIGWFPAYSY